jgi:hypothetical protein
MILGFQANVATRQCKCRVARLIAIGVSLLLACSGTETIEVVLELTTGDEAGALARAPAPATLILDSRDGSGNLRRSTRSPVGRMSFELGTDPPGTILSFAARAEDASGRELLAGTTLRHRLGEASRIRLFLSRYDTFTRLPSSAKPRIAGGGPSALILDRYFVSGATERLHIYDFLAFDDLAVPLTIPFPASSLVASGPYLLIIGSASLGRFAALDLASNTVQERTPPGPLDEVAGAAVTRTPGGASYLIGATRSSDTETRAVWRVASDGASVTLQSLAMPRTHAVATAIYADKVFVISKGARPELLESGPGRMLEVPVVPETPIAAAAQDDRYVVVIFETGEVLRYDVLCNGLCVPERWPARAQTSAGAAAVANRRVLFVGPEGASLLSQGGNAEVKTQGAHLHPSLFMLPTRGIGLLDDDGRIESFLPGP